MNVARPHLENAVANPELPDLLRQELLVLLALGPVPDVQELLDQVNEVLPVQQARVSDLHAGG